MDKRVVSLIPSGTEIVCALGCEAWLVGRSHECDFPAGVSALPALTEAKFPTDGTSAEIDGHVKAILETGLSVYRVDAERLEHLRPEVIVTQDHCEVCAASLEDIEAAMVDWRAGRPALVSLRPQTLADAWSDIARVAAALGRPDAGAALIAGLEARMNAIARAGAGIVARPRVACIEWIDPLMAAGNWIPEMVAMAGGVDVLGVAGEHSDWLEWDALSAADPDLIVLMPCGFNIARTRAELMSIAAKPAWRALRAVRAGAVYVVDGNQYFNRPGPRLAESVEILAEILHPEHFDFAHAQRGWVRLPRDGA